MDVAMNDGTITTAMFLSVILEEMGEREKAQELRKNILVCFKEMANIINEAGLCSQPKIKEGLQGVEVKQNK